MAQSGGRTYGDLRLVLNDAAQAWTKQGRSKLKGCFRPKDRDCLPAPPLHVPFSTPFFLLSGQAQHSSAGA